MKRPKFPLKLPRFGRQTLVNLVLTLASVLLLLLLLVLIPLKTHRTPVPDVRYTEHKVKPEATPAPTPIPTPVPTPVPNTPVEDEALLPLLNAFLESHPGSWDVYVMNMSHGEYASVGTVGDTPVISASLIKLFIMGAVYEQLQAETITFSECRWFLREMITKSDNYSANRLITLLGAGDNEAGFEAVNTFARSIGCESTQLNRMMEEKSELQNYTSAADCARFLRLLYRYELVSPQYSEAMLELLRDQRVNDRIPYPLPKEIRCAHKTGDLTGICCGDAGLVFSPNADYILAVICNYPENDKDAVTAIQELSAAIYDYYNPPSPELPEETPEG